MKVINSSINVATLTFSRSTRTVSVPYISVTRPTYEFDEIDVTDNTGNFKIFGAGRWRPIEFEVDQANYDLVLANTPCNIEFKINGDSILATLCYVRQDSIPGYILKIHTNDVEIT